ncbi:hypothetical protein [Algicola sagamiensis]|uniref:hypothetical protein n=1 Tax=Algicola sagamiensis TaxID=163869 RepID=UPI0003671AF7|nr:hypothetical protein [Algicola sagamiensis]
MLNIKQLRHELQIWGNYWYSKEFGMGYNRRAATEKIGLGRHVFQSSADFSVPTYIEKLDKKIGQLRPECVKALRVEYIVRKPARLVAKQYGFDSIQSFQFWLARAERTLILKINHFRKVDSGC